MNKLNLTLKDKDLSEVDFLKALCIRLHMLLLEEDLGAVIASNAVAKELGFENLDEAVGPLEEHLSVLDAAENEEDTALNASAVFRVILSNFKDRSEGYYVDDAYVTLSEEEILGEDAEEFYEDCGDPDCEVCSDGPEDFEEPKVTLH